MFSCCRCHSFYFLGGLCPQHFYGICRNSNLCIFYGFVFEHFCTNLCILDFYRVEMFADLTGPTLCVLVGENVRCGV